MKTDHQLHQDVCAELNWEPSIQATRIGVAVKDGVVTLTGDVDSFADKWQAERSAQRVGGVKSLAVDLKVQLQGSDRRTDADIARAVESVLQWSANGPAGALKVMVEGGCVTLSGDVDWKYQKEAAVDSVSYLVGVTGVSDQISIKPRVSAQGVQSDIEAALRRTAQANAQTISVEVRGTEVTLGGTARSWAQRELASKAAWGSPGVCNVIDQIQMAH